MTDNIMGYELPTIEECREFLRTINRGREAIGLDALETLDFDACEPGNPRACLSATHLFHPAGFEVGVCDVRRDDPDGERAQDKLIAALAMPPAGFQQYFKIPPAIARVTRVFDASDPNDDRTDDGYGEEEHDLYLALRERMIEAGVV